METRMNHWKLTSIGMAVVIVTALVTGLVVARWYGPEISRMDAQTPVAELPPRSALAPAASPNLASPPIAAPAPQPSASPTTEPGVASGRPPQSVVQACNQVAARESGANTTTKDKTIDIVKDAAVGAVGGAAVGALGGAIAGGGKGAGKGAAIGGVVGGGAGTVYGIYTNRQNDEKYRSSYSACMKQKGYTT